jgi:predicted nucleotidyltransferase component of viral defense system
MEIPLLKRLRKRMHQEIALLQDELVEILYGEFQKHAPVLHGGTAIWRCYNGNRFSEDLDFYMQTREDFKESFLRDIAARNLEVITYKQTQNVIFAKVSNGTVEVRLEINIAKRVGKIVGEYEKADGSKIDVYTLSPEALVEEKMLAYQKRRMVMDIYDIYHLSRYAEKVHHLKEFLKEIKPPLDEKNLRAVVYSGVAPSFKEMVEILSSRFSI